MSSSGAGSALSGSAAGNSSKGGAKVTNNGTNYDVVTWSGSGGGTLSGSTTTGTGSGHGGGGQGGIGFGAGVSYQPSNPPVVAVSDRRSKLDVEVLGELPNGLRLYAWSYLGSEERFAGVMAQDLLLDPHFAGALVADADGLMRVDYAMLGLKPANLEAMTAAGEAAVSFYRGTLH